MANPFDACSDITTDNQINEQGTNLIVMASRGKCPFAQKTLNAQKIGAHALIIVDNVQEDVEAILPFSKDSSTEVNVQIPTILIDKQSSEPMIRAIKAHANQIDQKGENVGVGLKFPMKKRAKSTVDYKLDLNDDYNIKNFIVLTQFFKNFGEKIKFNPVFNVEYSDYDKGKQSPYNCIAFGAGYICGEQKGKIS